VGVADGSRRWHADADDVRRALRPRVRRVAGEQRQLEARDGVAMGEAAGEALLQRAIDRIREVVLLPHRDELVAVRPLADPEDPERIRGWTLRVGEVVEPREVAPQL